VFFSQLVCGDRLQHMRAKDMPMYCLQHTTALSPGFRVFGYYSKNAPRTTSREYLNNFESIKLA
jgi:hypothetical protein